MAITIDPRNIHIATIDGNGSMSGHLTLQDVIDAVHTHRYGAPNASADAGDTQSSKPGFAAAVGAPPINPEDPAASPTASAFAPTSPLSSPPPNTPATSSTSSVSPPSGDSRTDTATPKLESLPPHKRR